MKVLIIYLCALGVVSVVAFFTYLADKIKAKRGAWRIRESVLLSLGFFGGAAGALISMSVFRHKTRHWYFWAVNFAGLVWQIAAGALIFVLLV